MFTNKTQHSVNCTNCFKSSKCTCTFKMVANKFLVNQNHWELLADQTLLDFNMNEIVTKSDKEVNYLQNWQSDLITLEQEYKEESEKSRLLIQQLKEMDAKMNLKLDLLENEVNEFTVS